MAKIGSEEYKYQNPDMPAWLGGGGGDPKYKSGSSSSGGGSTSTSNTSSSSGGDIYGPKGSEQFKTGTKSSQQTVYWDPVKGQYTYEKPSTPPAGATLTPPPPHPSAPSTGAVAQTVTQPQVAVQTATQPQVATRSTPEYDPEQLLSMWRQQLDEALFPYQQQLQQLLARQPSYTPPSEQEMLQLAQQYAGLQVDPRLQAIQRQLEQYQQQAEAERARIEAAYATVPERTQQLLDEARRYALESAIARGAGRSGVVNWETEKRTTPIMTQAQQAEAERASRLSDVESALRTAQQQAAEQQLALEEQRGNLQQQYLQALRDQAYARAVGDWQREFDAAQRLATLAAQAYQWGETAALSWAPYFLLTEAERQQLPLTWTETAGEVPSTAPAAMVVPSLPGESGGDYLVAVRDYLQGRATVDWDPATGEVIVNGYRFRPEEIGGRVVGGTALVPKSFLDRILRGV